MLGAFGSVLLFLCGLVLVGILGAFVFAYAAHCLLVVVTDTAAGQDEIRWPGDPVLDWLGHSLQVALVLALWLVPAGVLSRALGDTLYPNNGLLRLLALAVPGLWLFFPVGLLSSLSAASPVVVFSPALVGRLLRVLPSLVVFYALTAGVAGVPAWVWGMAVLVGHPYLIPVAAVVRAWGWLVYGRLLGRLAWKVRQLPDARRAKPPAGKLPVRKRAKVKVEDPWGALPPGTEPPAARKRPRTPTPAPEEPEGPGLTPYGTKAERVEPYGFADAAPFVPPVFEPAAAPPPPADDLPMPAADDDATAAPRERPDLRPSELEMRLRDRTPTDPPPAWPFFSGVYDFPWYDTSLKVWFRLVLGGTALGFGLRFLLQHMVS